MIRKLLMITVAALLSFAPMEISAETAAGIRQMGREEQISSSYGSRKLIYQEKEARLYYGEGGIDILSGTDHFHLDTGFAVLNLEILEDYTGDGYPEFITWQKTPELSDQVIIISGKDGAVIDSLRFTYEMFDYNAGFSTKNSSIQKLLAAEAGHVYIVCDYTVYRYSLREKIIEAKFSAPDNIWDIEAIWDLNENGSADLAAACQNGTVYMLDSQTMGKLDEYQLTKTLRRMSDYGDFEFVAVMNLWDLHFDGMNLYMTAENGVIYAMDRDGLWDEYSCAIIEEEELMTRIINNRNGGGIWIKDVVVIDETESEDIQDVSTGKMNKAYMSYRIADDDGSHLLISCYLGDPYCAAQYDQSDYPAAVAVFNKETSQIESRIVLDGYPGYEYQKPCFGRYSDQDVVCVLSDMQDNPKATLYSLAGETVLQKTLVLGEVLKPMEGMLALSWDGTSYLLEIFDGPSVVLGSDLESKGYLFDSIEYVFLSELNGNLFFKKKVNGAVRGLICYDSQMNVIWQYDYSAAYKNSGIDEISWGFYNNDKISDFLLLASQYDSKNTLVSTYFIVLDGASGKVLLNRNLKLGTYRDSNNKKHDYYLTASTASLIRDVDKDGKAEILCDGNSFVTSKSFKNNGSISDYIETSGNLLVIGDANGDGFDDKVSVTNKETRLYLSRLRYSYGTYMVDYVRTKTTRTNQEKWKNSQNALVFGDINNDGVSEIIHFAGNAKGYQVFVVTNGKTLKDMYVLCPDGVHDYYERFAVQSYDLNSDGYNEIIGSQYYDNIQLFDGKTGEVLLTDIGAYSFGKGFEMDTSFHPDYIVAFNKMEDAEHIFLGADYNQDGKSELVVCQQWYDEEKYESLYTLFIYSGADLSLLERKDLDRNFYGKVIPLKGKRNLLLQNDGQKTTLTDSLTGKSTASYQLNITDGYYLDENHLMAFTFDGKTYVLNSEMNFILKDEIPQQIDGNSLDLHWDSMSEFSIMTITDNGYQVYKGQDDARVIKLIEGEHLLTFDMDDGRGKISSQSFRITVMPQKKNTALMVTVTVMLLLIIMTISVYRKLKVRRAGKAVSRHE